MVAGGAVGVGPRSMCESIFAVDSLAIQRSLTILEDRYHELRESGERRHEAWEKENTELKQQLAAQSETLQQIKETRDEQAARVQVVEGELAALKSEREVVEEEKVALQHSAAELKQQLAAQSETLQQIKETRDEQAARVQVVEGELAALKSERDDALGNVREAREEAELTLLQLHQVQEELEHYFQISRSSDQLVEAQAKQNIRAVALIGRMLRLQALTG